MLCQSLTVSVPVPLALSASKACGLGEKCLCMLGLDGNRSTASDTQVFSGRRVVSRDALEASALLHDSIISRLSLITLLFAAFRRRTMTQKVFI